MSIKFILVSVCTYLIYSLPAFGANKYWVCNDNSWDATCWSSIPGGAPVVGQPQVGDNVFLTQSDSTNRVISYKNALNPADELNLLSVDATGLGTVTFSQSQDALNVRSVIIANMGTGAYGLSGTGILNTNFLQVGVDGIGLFTQSAGVSSVASRLTLGAFTGTGEYHLSGTGTFTTYDARIGDQGSGKFIQSGGSSTFTSRLSIGYQGGTGEYQLSGGDLIVSLNEYVGFRGIGLFDQSGGTHTVKNLFLGYDSASGSYTLSSGQLNVQSLTVGKNSSGTFTQTGGVTQISAGIGLMIAENNLVSGSYVLENGSLSSDREIIGSSGFGEFIQRGGTNITTEIRLGDFSGGTGSYSLSNNGQLTVNSTEYVGLNGSGVFTQNGGTHVIGQSGFVGHKLVLGFGTNSSGQYTLDGSGILTVGTEYIGNGIKSSGLFLQYSGTHTVTNDIYIGNKSESSGTYELRGGILDAGNVRIGTYGSGLLRQEGGSLNAGNLYLGFENGLGTASYEMSGGQLTVANGQIGGQMHAVYSQTGGTANFSNQITLGQSFSGSGIYNLSNNSQFLAKSLTVGSSGTGDFNQSGGSAQVTYTLALGTSANSGGNYNLSDGTVSASDIIVGRNGSGSFNQSGGQVNVSNRITTKAGNGFGRYTLSGGTLTAKEIVNNGLFEFVGGALTINSFDGNLENNGGTLTPGNSIGLTTINGDYTQDINGILAIEIGGLLSGIEYDVLDVIGAATLGGTLAVDWFDLGNGLFDAALGDSFDILSAETFSGEFDLLSLAVLGDGLKWQMDYLFDEIGTTDIARLTVVSSVPVPSAIWLFGSGLLSLIGMARRKKM